MTPAIQITDRGGHVLNNEYASKNSISYSRYGSNFYRLVAVGAVSWANMARNTHQRDGTGNKMSDLTKQGIVTQ